MQSATSFWQDIQPLFALVGLGGLTIASAVAAAFALFKWMGEKWVDQHFKKELERSKNEHQQELERLKHRINSVFDRTIRLHTKEYEVLPDLWGRLVDAYRASAAYLSAFQSYPNVSRMRDDELEELLAGSPFTDSQKKDVRDSGNRLDTYVKLANFYRYKAAIEKLQEFNDHFRRNGIFVQPELKSDMDRMIDFVWRAVTEQRTNEEENVRPRLRVDQKKLEDEGKPLFAQIEKSVQARLWDSALTDI